MAQVSGILDNAQRFLRDATRGQDGTIWTRAELLTYLQDGYREILSRAHCTHRLIALPTPPRHTMTITYPWERRYTLGGTARQWTYSGYDERRQFTSLWEVERGAGLTPQGAHTAVTQLWELAYVAEVDQHYRFILPKDHDHILGLWHDHEPLAPITTRELDYQDDAWYRRQGDPLWWAPAVTGVRAYEIYYIDVTANQAYAIDSLYGTMRYPSGARTYTAETADGVTHGWAYTTPAEAQAWMTSRTDFDARLATTQRSALPAEMNQNYTPIHEWTIGNGEYRCTQPWEVDPNNSTATGFQRGQFPWAISHGSHAPQATTRPVGEGVLSGIGLRITRATEQGYYCTQPWEVERHHGVDAAEFTAGETVGTAAWERNYGAANVEDLQVGAPRQIISPDRQYWPENGWSDPLGVIRSWQSSVDALLAWDVVTPHTPTLLDDRVCEPEMLPAPTHKYLTYYVLAKAFGRQGEGHESNLALHFQGRYLRVLRLMQRLKDVTWRDQHFQRQSDRLRRGRIPVPQLPPDYPRVPWTTPV